jgi:CheY-like chemotaxis protein
MMDRPSITHVSRSPFDAILAAREVRRHAVVTRRKAHLVRTASAGLRARADGARVWARVTAASRRNVFVIAGASGDGVRRGPGRTRVVLVVDDHDDTRQMYVHFLEAMGVRTVEATTCAEAVARSKAGGVDAVVLDRRLEDGDGAEVCRVLKSDPRTRAMPVVVLSGRAQDGFVDADAYLLKPVLPERLLEELERLIARAESR